LIGTYQHLFVCHLQEAVISTILIFHISTIQPSNRELYHWICTYDQHCHFTVHQRKVERIVVFLCRLSTIYIAASTLALQVHTRLLLMTASLTLMPDHLWADILFCLLTICSLINNAVCTYSIYKTYRKYMQFSEI